MSKIKARSSSSFASLRASNDRLKYLLEECENGESFKNLSKKQYEELWELLCSDLLSQIGVEGYVEKTSGMIRESLALLESAIKSDATLVGSSTSCIKTLTFLNEKSQKILDAKTLNALCKINETWLSKDLPIITGMEVFCLRHLFSLVASVEKPLALDLKRLYSFRCHIEAELLEDHLAILNKVVQNSAVASSDSGQKFIGYVTTLSGNLFNNIFRTIALELSSCTKKTAVAYGKALMMSWYNASEELKPQIQTRFQDLMEEFIKLKRTSLELSKRSSNILHVIDVWNVEVRKKGNNSFVTMITECYQPILWKYLQSGLNFERCNAADLFLKAFPLQLPGNPNAESELFTTQVRYMEIALRDDCHIVRIIAVREVCNILSVYWSQFSSVQIQKLISIITKEDAADLSSADVRRMVWRGLECFLQSEPAFTYLQQILPLLADYVHDVNQRVRTNFIQLLIAIRNKKDPNFKFTAVVNTSTLLNNLAAENVTVGRWIVKLLLPSFYQPEMEPREWIRRFSVLVKKYPQSYRNFFMYSNKVLPFGDAHLIMCELITYLGGFVMKKLKEGESDQEGDDMENRPSVANFQKSGALRKDRKSTQKDQSSSQGNCAFDDPAVVVGIFDIVTILWVLVDENLSKPENMEKRLKLLDTYIQFAQCFINYYKETKLFNSVVTLSGCVPMALLTANSITLPGYCMKTLKTMRIEASPEEEADNLSMLVALVKWGRGSQILEQVTIWLEAAFDTVTGESLDRAVKRVKINEIIQPDSLVAVHLLDSILKTEHTKAALMRKNYNQLLELWKLMGTIKELIYRRLLRGQAYSESLLSDEFLKACFSRYVRMIPLLHPLESVEDALVEEDKVKLFDGQSELMEMLQWARDDIIPMLQADADNCNDLLLIAYFVNSVLRVSDNMITVRLVDETIYAKLGQITISLLTFEHNLHFVDAAVRIATSLSFMGRIRYITHGADDLRIWATIVPSLLSHALNAMVSRPHTLETLDNFKQDFHAVKINIGKILATYEDQFSVQNKSKESLRSLQLLLEKILQATRVVLGREVPRDDMSVPIFSSLTSLPPAAATILAPLYNKPFWTPMFLVIIKQQLGRSVKTLLIDILIINLFGKIENPKWLVALQSTVDAATTRLKQYKFRRESGEVRSMGVTLCNVVEGENNDSEKTCVEQVLSDSQVNSAASMTRLVGSDGKPVPRGSEAISSTECTKSRGSQPLSTMATYGDLASRGSEPISNMATMCTESRNSQPLSTMETFEVPSCPQLDLESRSSQPIGYVDTMGSQGTLEPASSQPFSQVANMGSQPLSSQPLKAGEIEVPPAHFKNHNIPEDDLIDDFINCGEELLDSVKTLLLKRADKS